VAPFAIKELIDGYFVRNVHEIEIISFGVKNGEAEETIARLQRLGIPSMPIRVTRNAIELLQSDFKLNYSSILLFDSPENFNQSQ
jgi:hypothetical protein